MKTAIFFHVAKMNTFQDVYKEIYMTLDKFLLSSCNFYCENFADPELFEFPTLDFLLTFAKTNPNYNILYIHSKGVSRPENESVADWRKCMTYFMVERYKECLEKLNSFDTVGINFIPTPMPHWQGNFWWATSNYIAKLQSVRHIDSSHFTFWQERHKAEAWIFSGKPKAWQLYHHNILPYKIRNPRSNYEKFVSNGVLTKSIIVK